MGNGTFSSTVNGIRNGIFHCYSSLEYQWKIPVWVWSHFHCTQSRVCTIIPICQNIFIYVSTYKNTYKHTYSFNRYRYIYEYVLAYRYNCTHPVGFVNNENGIYIYTSMYIYIRVCTYIYIYI